MENAVLATLNYAAATNTPLTSVQVWMRMIRPERVGGSDAPTLPGTLEILSGLVSGGRAQERDGWYAPADADGKLFRRRLEQANINASKWKLMLRKAWWLQIAPFVQAIAASGSLASGTTGPDSDWDMFVIARRGRLYSARFFLLLISQFMGRLRVKEHRFASDLFCFNHYVADDGLCIRHRSLFVAHALSRLTPIHDPSGRFRDFLEQNDWIREYLAMKPIPHVYVRKTVARSFVLSAVRRFAEASVDALGGNILESVLRLWQKWRISRVPDTYGAGGRVVCDEREIEFHPRSAERAVLASYNVSLHGLSDARQEIDSGLTS